MISTKTKKLVFGIMLLCGILGATENAFAQESDLNSILENALKGGGGAKKGGAKKGGGVRRATISTKKMEELEQRLAAIEVVKIEETKSTIDTFIAERMEEEKTTFRIVIGISLFLNILLGILCAVKLPKAKPLAGISNLLQREIKDREALGRAHEDLKRKHDALKSDHDALSNRVP